MPSESALRDGNGSSFGLIETFRWEPGSGFVRLERHLARLVASSAVLGFVYPEADIRDRLARIRGNGALRVRLELSATGTIDLAAQPFVPLPADTVWNVRIAQAQLDSTDTQLRHKTTRRGVYDAARAEFSRDDADEVILLNELGEICEGTITTIFAERDDGILVTPPLSSGLLAGVLREELLASGKAVEKIVHHADLERYARLFCGNSLRGLIPVSLR
ncbi:aminotransferase class IV family protein [Oryzicola mucosus]|uniref:Probable branched-chain-amino-acid aminotransferase n=1 Tax=Oryzicola mucosus TaxID=2767425 RepID=A0A8J6PHY7_9HYPH|nr:aminotransferase class IV family protein [Oryzicola mucosus]MBD0414423.1 aminotransferase class IV family protein [Oryzicola mucosus]